MTKISVRRAMTILCVTSIAALTPRAQAAQQSGPFRSSTELVSVDVLATDADRRPVTDLSPADFQLKVDGKTRPVQSTQLVRAAGTTTRTTTAPASAAAATTPLPPPFNANTDPPGRTFIFAVDQESIHPGNERQAIDAMTRLLDRLTPTDRVAVITVPRGRVEADLTTDREAVRAALARVQGHAMRSSSKYEISIEEALAAASRSKDDMTNRVVNEMIARECEHEGGAGCAEWVRGDAQIYGQQIVTQARDTVRGLAQLVDGLTPLDGTKSLVFVSERLVSSRELEVDLADLGRAADTARVRFFVVQVNRPMFDVGRRRGPADESGDAQLEVTGLGNVASVTGGELFRQSARLDNVLTHIDDITSSYYLLGFEPTDKDRDGKYHKIELTLTRRGVTLHSRGGFVIPTRSASQRTEADASKLASVLRDNLTTFRDLPLRATAFTFRGAAPDRVKVLVLADAPGTASLTEGAVAVISESGGQGAEWTVGGGAAIVTAGEVLAGMYRVRVAAADERGRQGAVDVRLDAQLKTAGPIQLSSLLTGQLTSAGFQPRLDLTGANEVTAYLELYNVPILAGTPSARVELLTSPDGPVLAGADMRVATADTPERRLVQGTVGFPASLPSGDLLVRVTIRLDGQPVGTTSRTIRG